MEPGGRWPDAGLLRGARLSGALNDNERAGDRHPRRLLEGARRGRGQTLLGGAQTRNIELRASFPSLEKTSNILAFQNTLRRVHSEQCPKVENRWVGSNRGCYQNAANDRVIDALRVAVDPAEQNALYRDPVRLQTEDLPLLPLYFVVELWNFRAGVSGPRATSSQTNILWNVVEWDAPSRAGA